MKNKIRNVFLSSVLLSMMGLGTDLAAANTSSTEESTNNSVANNTTNSMQKHKIHKWQKQHTQQCGMFAQAWLGAGGDKHLSSDDAKRIAEAALIWYNERNLKVGKIDTRVNNYGNKVYIINIEDQNNKLIRQVGMNSRTGNVHLISQPGA